MQDKLIVLNIGWMEYYQGLESDSITGGGEYVNEEKVGFEIYNFRPFEGNVFGFAQPSGQKPYLDRVIRVERIIKSTNPVDSVNEVLAVWVAPNPVGGTYVVGWYKNATVYRKYQPFTNDPNRKLRNEFVGYFVRAQAQDSVLLPSEERILRVPRVSSPQTRELGGIGHSNVWFADDNKLAIVEFRSQLKEFIQDYEQRQESAFVYQQSDPLRQHQLKERQVFYEGSEQIIPITVYERDSKARQACIDYYGYHCVICGFDFSTRYGEIGRGFIHVHHLRPLSNIGETYQINPVQDLRPVCPNCHAIIHRREPPYTIEEIKTFLDAAKNR